ncbi:glycerophosphodiester phosphodiesterase [Agrilactobacillus yilanensis]|uniref:Glycerophosphodiester phosphodiesterase n=1 Tax=Agrilactobacillus yilanensis TaxID=2485997 RepID=A0ABW4J7Y6_9LACO|nr:glycerophosphodiester phosphodiesterase family protein [Agrilactobacillus yilanensis]
MGHRGDPINAPEETFQSFDIAFNEGAEYVELDVHRSQDGVLVVSHDRNLERVTGQSVIVSSQPFSELHKLQTANGEPIHSLDEVFAHYQNNPNAKFLVETKKTKAGNPKDMEALLVETIKKYNMADRVMVHSFSQKSMEQMQTLMPEIPRIFIVGSLKRINFENLQYVNAINISSELVTAQLIDELHYLGKQVYVWDEMTEKQKSWNYIVNLPIDGVVTNYPSIGASYQQLKDNARISDMDSTAALVSDTAVKTFVNPYRYDLTKKALQPFTPVHVSQRISIGDQTYYQIDENRFVLANAVNLADDLTSAALYLNQKIQLKPKRTTQTAYASPLYPQRTTGIVLPNKNYKIRAVRSVSGSIWFKIKAGWVQSSQFLVQFKSMANDSQTALKLYLSQDASQRTNNINILASLPSMLTYVQQRNYDRFTSQTTENLLALKQEQALYPLILSYTNNNTKG